MDATLISGVLSPLQCGYLNYNGRFPGQPNISRALKFPLEIAT